MAFQSLKGFRDILPEEAARWRRIEHVVESLMRRYGFGEIRLPIVEATELFRRGVGEHTDVVGKEMYTFDDRSDPPESITLRPELTAGAVRAYVEHAVGQNQPLTRWYYVGPMFRYEQPQAGRYRQFHQFGAEILGSPYPETDAEVIAIGHDLLADLGIRNVRLRLNSIGMPEERAAYRAALREFLREREAQLSDDSRRRLDTNPMRVLDSKREEDVEACKGAPEILDHLGAESRQHFDTVREMLEREAIDYVVDPRLVRGLDYYTRTAFEFQGLDLGAQDALGGGGRYDMLVEQLGGKPAPAIGFSFGMERLLIGMEAAGAFTDAAAALDVYLVALDDEARRWAAGTAHDLRRAGVSVESDLLRRSMKAQMRDANRKNARRVVIVGSNELADRTAQVKDMAAGEQRAVPFEQLEAELVAASQG